MSSPLTVSMCTSKTASQIKQSNLEETVLVRPIFERFDLFVPCYLRIQSKRLVEERYVMLRNDGLEGWTPNQEGLVDF